MSSTTYQKIIFHGRIP